MMGSDARDVMGLPSGAGPKPMPSKTPKTKVRGPTGMVREVMDLNFEGAPPISIVAPKFKEKPKLPFKPRQWEETPFGNSARKDGLVLKHWRRKGDIANGGVGMPVTPADSNAASEMEIDDQAKPTIPDSYWAKYNVKVPRPQYTDAQYEEFLKSDDWSKEETDYLVDLAVEFDLRWIVIGDRYDYKLSLQPQMESLSTTTTAPPKSRTTEDLKARYYALAAKTMELHNPLSSMSSSEFDIHEKMTKYDPVRETQRKKYAEQLMSRTREEKEEEEYYLKELSRIVNNQERLANERRALYDRLEPPPGTAVGARSEYSTAMYQTSQGLSQLVQNLLTQTRSKESEKREKRRSMMDSSELSNGDRHARHSMASASGSHRASLGGGNVHSAARRQLSPRDEAKYGVSRPNERLTGGVSFRHERITKASVAKSGVQTSRIGAALTELKIPPRLVMPTAKVVTEYERLIERIKDLLEVRKVCEKVEGEIKVWKAQKEQAEMRERGEEVKEEDKAEGATAGNELEKDEEDETMQDAEESKVEDEEDEEEGDEKEDEKEDSDEEGSPNQEEEESQNEEEDAEVDADVDADADSVVDEVRELQQEDSEDEEEGEDEGAPEQVQEEVGDEGDENEENDADGDNDDDDASSRASAAPESRGAGLRKRSASIISHVSNKSSKRQRK
ncbi:hypothetical protein MMC21_003075 [Puttea exsequens]|nr:hypothetical protein [Puttea exsequens]